MGFLFVSHLPRWLLQAVERFGGAAGQALALAALSLSSGAPADQPWDPGRWEALEGNAMLPDTSTGLCQVPLTRVYVNGKNSKESRKQKFAAFSLAHTACASRSSCTD